MQDVKTPESSRGFTLIEVVIAMAIVGILAAVVFPSYTAYLRRSKIAAALGELSAVRVRLEQYYQDNRNYGTGTTCGVAMPASTGFTFTCGWGDGGTPQTFLVTATGDAAAGLNGFVYTVNQADEQKTTEFEGRTLTPPANCWLKKGGETC